MKKIVLLVVAITSFTMVKAQVGEGTNWLKMGIHGGLPVGDMSDISSFALGADLKYQFLDADSFAIGVSTGYTHYFGKDFGLVEASDMGIIPLAGLFRFYPTENFFLGTDIGYGFLTEGDEGGFYYRPEIGYHDDEWNIYGYYQSVATDGIEPTSIGIGINYNIVQGK